MAKDNSNTTIITYSDSWQISNLEKKTILTYPDVVTAVHWRYQRTRTATGPLIRNSEAVKMVDEIYGVTEINFNPNNFIPFANLTSSIISGWVVAYVDMDIITKTLTDRVNTTAI